LLGPSHPFLTGRSSKKLSELSKNNRHPRRGQAAGALCDADVKITIFDQSASTPRRKYFFPPETDRPARKPAPVVARTRKVPRRAHPVKRRAKKKQDAFFRAGVVPVFGPFSAQFGVRACGRVGVRG